MLRTLTLLCFFFAAVLAQHSTIAKRGQCVSRPRTGEPWLNTISTGLCALQGNLRQSENGRLQVDRIIDNRKLPHRREIEIEASVVLGHTQRKMQVRLLLGNEEWSYDSRLYSYDPSLRTSVVNPEILLQHHISPSKIHESLSGVVPKESYRQGFNAVIVQSFGTSYGMLMSPPHGLTVLLSYDHEVLGYATIDSQGRPVESGWITEKQMKSMMREVRNSRLAPS